MSLYPTNGSDSTYCCALSICIFPSAIQLRVTRKVGVCCNMMYETSQLELKVIFSTLSE